MVDGVGGNLHLRHLDDLDPFVLLDLADRGLQHVTQRYRTRPAPARSSPREHEQVLAVAAHPGRQVVKLEQVLQLEGVLLGGLQPVDERDLPFDEALAAPGQAQEQGVDVAPQAGLFGSQPHRLVLQLVEGARDLADLVTGVDGDGDGPDRRVDLVRVRGLQLLDQVGKALVGDVEGARPQSAQGAGHRARDRQRPHDRTDHDSDDQRAEDGGPLPGGGAQLARGPDDVVEQAGLDGAQQLDVGGAGREPLVGIDAEVGQSLTLDGTVGGALDRQQRLTVDDLIVADPVAGAGCGAERVLGRLFLGEETGHPFGGAELEPAGEGRGVELTADLGVDLLDGRQVIEDHGGVAELVVVPVLPDPAVEGEQAADRGRVLAQDRADGQLPAPDGLAQRGQCGHALPHLRGQRGGPSAETAGGGP